MATPQEALGDRAAAEGMLLNLTTEMGGITSAIDTNRKAMETHYTALTSHFNGLKSENEEIKKAVEKHTADYAALVVQQQTLQAGLDQVKREMDVPLLRGGSDLASSDKEAAIELQRRAWTFKGGDPDNFKEDLDNLIDAKQYRSACRKLVKHVGIEASLCIRRSSTMATSVSTTALPSATPNMDRKAT